MQRVPAVIAYFSMEVGLSTDFPFYAGGLGVLAGDSLKAAAELKLPIVCVTLLHRVGYFKQEISGSGDQVSKPETSFDLSKLGTVPDVASVEIAGRKVKIVARGLSISSEGQLRPWPPVADVQEPDHSASDHPDSQEELDDETEYGSESATRPPVVILFLDTNLPENHPEDRELTSALYGGDQKFRLSQEVLLGIGGVRLLRAAGFSRIATYHMNEGHAALLAAELLREERQAGDRFVTTSRLVESVRHKCVFTTHTPIAAGHDRFELELTKSVVAPGMLEPASCFMKNGLLDLTHTAISLSRWVNGVSKRHAEVCRRMFPGVEISSVTNGVHPLTWIHPQMQSLFDVGCSGWREDSLELRHAVGIDAKTFLAARARCKQELLARIEADTGVKLDAAAFTIGCARRFTGYKRLDLILRNKDRLEAIAAASGGLQIVYAGKSHPNDGTGRETIRRVHDLAATMPSSVRVVFLPNYTMELARILIAGSDIWLNTPLSPLEASGTSGMKAAMNGVPSLSILDGWWVEGCIEGVTGWSIGEDPGLDQSRNDEKDSEALYQKLEQAIVPLYQGSWREWARVCQQAVAINGTYFSTHRMMREYAARAYGYGR